MGKADTDELLYGMYKGDVKDMFIRKISWGLDGIGYEAGKINSWEKEEVGVKWIFDSGGKEWPEVKEKLGSMENILLLV